MATDESNLWNSEAVLKEPRDSLMPQIMQP
jgi:hypothetical protein